MLKRFFHLDRLGVTWHSELQAGVLAFLGLLAPLLVTSMLLAEAGIDQTLALSGSFLAAAAGSLLMGLYGRQPLLMAPSLTLTAFFSYTLVNGMGFSWPLGLGVMAIAGALLFLGSLLPLRLGQIIPGPVWRGFSAGLAMLLALQAIEAAGWLVPDFEGNLVWGQLTTLPALFTFMGFLVAALLLSWRSALVLLVIALLGIGLGLLQGAQDTTVVELVTPSDALFALSFDGLQQLGLFAILASLVIANAAENAATLRALLPDTNLPRAHRAAALGCVVAPLLGSASCVVTSQSALALTAGGRSGLTAVTAAFGLFVMAFVPGLIGVIPAYAMAPALLVAALALLKPLAEAAWDEPGEATALFITLLTLCFTQSPVESLTLGLLSYCLAKLATGKFFQLGRAQVVITAVLSVELLLNHG